MTELLSIAVVAGVALLAVVVVKRLQGTSSESTESNEPFKFFMPVETTKIALDQILSEPITCNAIDRYWGPAETVKTGEGCTELRYKIYFEISAWPDSNGLREQQLTHLTMTVKLRAVDEGNCLATLDFDDETKSLLGVSPESSLLKGTTLTRLTQRLAQLSIQRQGY